MDREELISKKDLLLTTGISYGQLYRWKRQRLLPDSWFIKMSSFPGQETYFPKQKVLERIRAIVEMKDAHSLDELANLFEPAGADREYSLLDAREVLSLSAAAFDACIRIWGKRSFTFMELLLIDMIAELERESLITPEEQEEGFASARLWTSQRSAGADGGEKRGIIFRKRGAVVFLFLEGPGKISLDAESAMVREYDMTERTGRLQSNLTKAMGEWA